MSKTRKVLLMLLALALLTPLLRALLAAMLPDASVNPVPTCIGGMMLALLTLGLPACASPGRNLSGRGCCWRGRRLC